MNVESLIGSIELDAQIAFKKAVAQFSSRGNVSDAEAQAFAQGFLAAQATILHHTRSLFLDQTAEKPRVSRQDIFPHPRHRDYRQEPTGWTVKDCKAAEVQTSIEAHVSGMSKPAIVLDLDGTLVDVSYRTLGIVKEWLASEESDQFPPHLTAHLSALNLTHIGYSLSHAFENAGLNLIDEDVAELFESIERHWRKRFFDGQSLVEFDRPIVKAQEFVWGWCKRGVQVIYLTGRSKKHMEAGTREQLRKLGFPEQEALLYMKHDNSLDDHIFKCEIFAKVTETYDVIANFENEYLNLHAMVGLRQQGCTHVILDTQHSGRPVPPLETPVFRLTDFS